MNQCVLAGPPMASSPDSESPEAAAPLPGPWSRQSFGGRGLWPPMMSSICAASMVSYCINASAIRSSLSRLSSQNLLGAPVAAIDDGPHFAVDFFRRLLRHMLTLTHLLTEEHFSFFFLVSQRAHFFTQAPLGHHGTGQLGGSLNIVGGTRGDTIKAQRHFFGNTTAEQGAD